MTRALTQDLVHLIERSEIDYMVDRMRAIEERHVITSYSIHYTKLYDFIQLEI